MDLDRERDLDFDSLDRLDAFDLTEPDLERERETDFLDPDLERDLEFLGEPLFLEPDPDRDLERLLFRDPDLEREGDLETILADPDRERDLERFLDPDRDLDRFLEPDRDLECDLDTLLREPDLERERDPFLDPDLDRDLEREPFLDPELDRDRDREVFLEPDLDRDLDREVRIDPERERDREFDFAGDRLLDLDFTELAAGDPADAERCDRFESLDRDLDFLVKPTPFTDPDLLERAGDTEPFLEGEFDFDRDLLEPECRDALDATDEDLDLFPLSVESVLFNCSLDPFAFFISVAEFALPSSKSIFNI